VRLGSALDTFLCVETAGAAPVILEYAPRWKLSALLCGAVCLAAAVGIVVLGRRRR
jgi:hypothetical protein